MDMKPKISEQEYQRWWTILSYAVERIPFFSMFSKHARTAIVNNIMVFVNDIRDPNHE